MERFGARALSVTGFAVVCVGLLVSLTAAAAGRDSAAAAGTSQAAASGGGPLAAGAEELPGLRTATSRSFSNPDGSVTNQVFSDPVNYQDAKGDWQPIDGRLSTATVPAGFAYRNAANSFSVEFADRAAGDFVAFGSDPDSFKLSLIGVDQQALANSPLAQADTEGGELVYPQLPSGVNLVYRMTSVGFKEGVVLMDDTAPSSFSFMLSPTGSRQLTARRRDDGGWGFFAAGEAAPVFRMAAPQVLESTLPRVPTGCTQPPSEPPKCPSAPSGPAAPTPSPAPRSQISADDGTSAVVAVPHQGSLDVVPAGAGFRVTLAVDSNWLRDPKRVFPVVLDPTIVLSGSSDQDATFTMDCSTCTPDAASDHVKVGSDGTHTYAAASKFDLSSIPTGSVVLSATYNAVFNSCFPSGAYDAGRADGCTWVWPNQQMTVDAHRVTSVWSSSTPTNALTIDSTVLSSRSLRMGWDGDQSTQTTPWEWLQWDLTGQVQQWVSLVQPNYGFVLENSAPSCFWGPACGISIPDSRNASTSQRPALVVTYFAQLGARKGSAIWSKGPLALNEATGNVMISAPSPSFATGVGTLTVPFTYNSLDTTSSGHPLGAGWTAGPVSWLLDHNVVGDSTSIQQFAGDGSSVVFTRVGASAVFRPTDHSNAQLFLNPTTPSPTYTVIEPDGSVYTYGSATSSGVASLSNVQSLAANYGTGEIDYGFTSGNLTSVTAIDGANTLASISLSWTCSGALVCLTGPDGQTWHYIGTSGSSGKLQTVYDGTRNVLKISYDGSGRAQVFQNADDLDPSYGGSHDLRIDAYDSLNRATTIKEENISGQTPATSTWTFGYHPDPTGASTTHPTSAAHSGISAGVSRIAGGYTTITPPCEQPSTICAGHSGTVHLTVYYDDLGQTMERVELPGTDGLAHYVQTQYDGYGQLLWSEDEDGNPTDYSYESVDNTLLTSTRPDPDGPGILTRPVISYGYDEQAYGSLSGTTYTPGTALHGLQASYFKTKNFVNAANAGRPDATETAVSSGTLSFTWGSSGPPALPGTATDFSVRFTGDLAIPAGLTPTLEFQTLAEGGTQLTFDNQLVIDHLTGTGQSTQTGAGFATTAGKHAIVLEYVESTASPNSDLTLQYRCSSGCGTLPTTFTTVPAAILTPAWNNRTSMATPAGRVAFSHFSTPWTANPDYTLAYAPVNGTNSPLVTSLSYDSLGRLSGKVLPNGNAAATIAGNGDLSAAGNPTTSNYGTTYSYYLPTDTAATPSNCSIHGTYNQRELPKTTAQHGLHTVTTVYTAAGLPASTTNAAGTTTLCYDTENRLSSLTIPGDAQATTYSYDAAGRLRTAAHSGSSDDTSGTVSVSYDDAGRVVDTVDANGGETTTSYNADGSPISRTDTPVAGGSHYTTNYSYNDAGQVIGETDPASRSYSFYYDKRGNLRGTSYPTTTATFSWNDTNPDGWLTGNYNRHGTINSATTTAPDDNNPLADFAYTYNQDGQRTRIAGGSYPAQITAAAPVLYWRLDETSGLTVGDSSGNGRTGSYAGSGVTYGAAGALTSDSDPAVALASPGNAERTSPGSALSIGSGSWTIEAWAKSSDTAAASQMIASRYECGWNNCVSPDGNANALYNLGLSNGRAFMSVRSDNGTSVAAAGSTDLRDGSWHHMAGVLDRAASLLRVYVDGTQVATANASSLDALNDAGSPLEVGRTFIATWGSPTDYFHGSIDEVAIYPTALTATQISSHRTRGVATDSTTYTYDTLSRLETTTPPSGATTRYCFDSDSNRTKIISPSSGTCSTGTSIATYSYTPATNTPIDALTSQTGPTRSFTYDGSGSSLGDGMITGIGADSVRYDGMGRLKSTTTSGKSICYRYGPDGSLKQRIYDSTGSGTCTTATSTTNYLIGGSYETNSSNTITTSYQAGPSGALASFNGVPTTASTVSYLFYNGHGDLAAETNSAGTATAIHTYDAFGGPSDTPPANATSHRYTGAWSKQYDSTNNLILMGARPYDPTLGRFYAVDPVDGGSLNNYDYAGQDPINGYDLDGRRMCGDSCDGGGLDVAGATIEEAAALATEENIGLIEQEVRQVAEYHGTVKGGGSSWGYGGGRTTAEDFWHQATQDIPESEIEIKNGVRIATTATRRIVLRENRGGGWTIDLLRSTADEFRRFMKVRF
jgi:RHS repeat-associated protein